MGLKFVKMYRDHYKPAPSFYPVNGSDLLRLVKKAVSVCEINSTCIHRKITANKNFEGLTGPLTFADGKVLRQFTMKVIQL